MLKIKEIVKGKKYAGVVCKTIGIIKDRRIDNYFTSFTFANDKYLNTCDFEWLHFSGENATIKDYDKVKTIVEFEVEKDKIYIARHHLSIDEFWEVLKNIEEKGYYKVRDRMIHTNVEFIENEQYKIGSISRSIFKNANVTLHRMSDVFVGWSKGNDIYKISNIDTANINSIEVMKPIESLLGFIRCDTLKELCSCVCIYLPNYSAWLSNDKFEGGKRVEVNVCTENEELLKRLVLLYKINKTKEVLIFESYKFDKVNIEKKEGELTRFFQPIPHDVDSTMFILLNDDFEIEDFTCESVYVKRIEFTLDSVTTGRKNRMSFSIGKKPEELNKGKIKERKDLITLKKPLYALFASGEQSQAIEAIRRILNKARVDISMLDPYFGSNINDWQIFSDTPTNIPIEILTCLSDRNQKNKNNFSKIIEELRKEVKKVECKDIYYKNPHVSKSKIKCPFHDRYIIIDKKRVWMLGTSVNGFGKRDSSIIELKSKEAMEIVERYKYYWEGPSPIHKVLNKGVWVNTNVGRNII